MLTRKQVPTWKKSDFRHTTRLDRPLPGWGWGGVQLYKIGFLQIPDASNKCSATKQKLVNFPWKRLLERCVPARVPRFHNFSGVGDKNWVQLRPLEHNLIFIEDLGWIGQLDVKSWDRTGMTIHQLSIFQPRSHAACKRVSKINKYGQFHDIYDGKLASLNFALEMDICHLYKFRHHSPAFCLTLFWKSRT